MISGQVREAYDLTSIVESQGKTKGAAKGPEVRHFAVLPKKRVRVARATGSA